MRLGVPPMRRFACCLLLIAAAACQEDPAGPVPREIRSLAADTLTGIVGTPADTIVVIRVVDAEGNGVQGKSVTFVPAANAGSAAPATATTDADGVVSTTWTLGATAGVQQLTVRGAGLTDVIVPAIALMAPTPREVAVSAFRSHSCGLVGGVAKCWGDNAAGKLGVGDVLPRTGPSVVAGGNQFVSIMIGGMSATETDGTCALTGAGATWCWGFGATGANQPTLVASVPPFKVLSMGEEHACGLDSAGSAWCWGTNTDGRLGVGDNAARTQATRVSGTLRFRDIEVGTTHSCGLTRQGAIYCWGSNSLGQLGNGSTAATLVPAPINSTTRFMTLDVGSTHNCAVAITGALECWGSNSNGRSLGNGVSGNPVFLPQSVPGLQGVVRVSTGPNGTCGMLADGSGICWGSNSSYQLADTMTNTQVKPLGPMHSAVQFREIRIGAVNSCGVAMGGGVYCWGFNGSRVVGHPDEYEFATPQLVLGGHSFVQVEVGTFHSCGLKADGSTWCWGWNNRGNVGNDAPPRVRQPVRVLAAPSFQAIDAGGESTCGLTPSGAVYCWGSGSNGEIGDGQFVETTIPTRVGIPDGMVAMSLGWGTGCALTPAGVAWCWGREGTFTAQRPAALPAAISAPEALVTISVGHRKACGRGVSGIAYCWAPRFDAAAPAVAQPEFGGVPVSVVAAGSGGACVIRVSGSGSCYGLTIPDTPIGATLTTIYSAMWPSPVCGIGPGNVGYCWASEAGLLAPTPVPGGLSWKQLSTGVSHVCGVTTANVAYCWGGGPSGELGNGVSRYFPTPVAVP